MITAEEARNSVCEHRLYVVVVHCDRCVHAKECDRKEDCGGPVLCKTDEFGRVIEYERYEPSVAKK